VCVRLLVDGFGGRDFVEHLQAPLDAAASMCRSTAASGALSLRATACAACTARSR
jgi:hypothetical protein